jgi:Flp pilus assembly pilin Flp
MYTLHPTLSRFIADESAATAVDYGLVVTLVSIAALAIFNEIGQTLIVVHDAASSSIASTTP